MEAAYLIPVVNSIQCRFHTLQTRLPITCVCDPQLLLHHGALLRKACLVLQLSLVPLASLQQLLSFKCDRVGHLLGAGRLKSQPSNLVLEKFAFLNFFFKTYATLVDVVTIEDRDRSDQLSIVAL